MLIVVTGGARKSTPSVTPSSTAPLPVQVTVVPVVTHCAPAGPPGKVRAMAASALPPSSFTAKLFRHSPRAARARPLTSPRIMKRPRRFSRPCVSSGAQGARHVSCKIPNPILRSSSVHNRVAKAIRDSDWSKLWPICNSCAANAGVLYRKRRRFISKVREIHDVGAGPHASIQARVKLVCTLGGLAGRRNPKTRRLPPSMSRCPSALYATAGLTTSPSSGISPAIASRRSVSVTTPAALP